MQYFKPVGQGAERFRGSSAADTDAIRSRDKGSERNAELRDETGSHRYVKSGEQERKVCKGAFRSTRCCEPAASEVHHAAQDNLIQIFCLSAIPRGAGVQWLR